MLAPHPAPVMPLEVPAEIDNSSNRAVLAHLAGKSAHSDVGEVLVNAAKPLGAASLFCPDWNACRYVVASTGGVVFAFAVGMSQLAFRLDATMRERALVTGGVPIVGCGEGWVAFTLFRSDWPQVDTNFWALKAYAFAREGAK